MILDKFFVIREVGTGYYCDSRSGFWDFDIDFTRRFTSLDMAWYEADRMICGPTDKLEVVKINLLEDTDGRDLRRHSENW
jgi:hypothetical protein